MGGGRLGVKKMWEMEIGSNKMWEVGDGENNVGGGRLVYKMLEM